MPRRSRHEPTLDAATVAAVQVALAPFELRLTANRRAVLAALGGGARPLTVEEVVDLRTGAYSPIIFINGAERLEDRT